MPFILKICKAFPFSIQKDHTAINKFITMAFILLKDIFTTQHLICFVFISDIIMNKVC